MRLLLILPAVFTVCACVPRGDISDPAYGGFFRGISNIQDGTYDARIASREQRVAALQERQRRLIAERNSLSRKISAHQNALAQVKHDLVLAKVRVGDQMSPAMATQVDAAINAKPSGTTDAERLAALQKTIADTRKLAESLANLSG
ncbi:MAG: hypothetical protein AAF393_11915 [Pseudomonadota bacterium]